MTVAELRAEIRRLYIPPRGLYTGEAKIRGQLTFLGHNPAGFSPLRTGKAKWHGYCINHRCMK
jgi:hypothetical protein